MSKALRLHGTCVARDGAGVLLVGPSGSGKSDLALRLLARGFDLVADDQVDIVGDRASAPAPLAGLLEVRGFGIIQRMYVSHADLKVVIRLAGISDRLPEPERHPMLDLPMVHIDASTASAPDRVILALDCAQGLCSQVAGSFAK
jgi:HPr kinase/phosphorylase